MGQTLSDEQQPHRRSRDELTFELAQRFRDQCFSSLEFYSLKDVFNTLADRQGHVRYLREDTVGRYLEMPDILGASPVVFQMLSYLGAFPFLQDAPAVLELAPLVMVVVILTDRYRRVLAKGAADRTKLLFKSLAVHDRQAWVASGSPPPNSTMATGTRGFAVDAPGEDDGDGEDGKDEGEDDDLVLTAYELLHVTQTSSQVSSRDFHCAIIPTDNFRKLLMLLLLSAPLQARESLSQYSSRVSGEHLEILRSTAENMLASFVDAETSAGIRYKSFKTIMPVLFPHLFRGFNGLFERFLFSKHLDLSRRKGESRGSKDKVTEAAQPLLSDHAEILNDHVLSQLSMFIPASSLFRRVRLLYSGNEAGFSMGSFESKVFNWRAPTVLLVSGTRLDDVPDGGQEAAFADSLPTNRFPAGSKSGRVTYGVYVQESWRHTHKACFGGPDTVLFQLEPIHDVFPASTLNTEYIAFTKTPGSRNCLSIGCPHPKQTQSHNRRDGAFALGAVSLLLNDSFEFGVFNHDYKSRGGAFHTSLVRRCDFQDRFQIDRLEVWGCGGDDEAKAQAERWAWEAREAESRRRINLGSGDMAADRALLEMAGIVGGHRSGGSMA
ncbi:TLDc domain containing protein 2 [Ophiocordyceps camponoti-floridani]|uniref:Restriction of telomere capping protein 5 n=1 Tax=Ophiocordyceps camponoti-floridani TaxID=2030778 RepID=A0A8H4QA80_9HYPO|nr:TLDc domain containing protein 2 [Ophiocordyceps camponoti-floridani]